MTTAGHPFALPASIPACHERTMRAQLWQCNQRRDFLTDACAVELAGHVRSKVRRQAVKFHPLVLDRGMSAHDPTLERPCECSLAVLARLGGMYSVHSPSCEALKQLSFFPLCSFVALAPLCSEGVFVQTISHASDVLRNHLHSGGVLVVYRTHAQEGRKEF